MLIGLLSAIARVGCKDNQNFADCPCSRKDSYRQLLNLCTRKLKDLKVSNKFSLYTTPLAVFVKEPLKFVKAVQLFVKEFVKEPSKFAKEFTIKK